jgi:hypothetical protein
MGWTVQGSNLVGARFSTTLQPGLDAHQASCTMGAGSFTRVKQPGCGVDHPPHLVLRLKKSTATPLLPLWAFVASSRVTFTFCYYINTLLTHVSTLKGLSAGSIIDTF